MNKLVKNIFFIGILLIFPNELASINVDCEYKSEKWIGIGRIYNCIMQKNINISSPNNATITSVTGTHEPGRNNSDVEGFRCRMCNIEYFPKGLENIFPNVKSIEFHDNKIKEVHQSDFKPFPNVEVVALGKNSVKVIEEDLFKFNPKLKLISFTGNPISYIHPNVFDDLNELRYLWLSLLLCMSDAVSNNSIAIKELIKEVKSNCNDTEYSLLDGKFKNLEIHHDSFNSTEFNQQLIELDKIFTTSNYSKLSTFQKRIKKLSDIKEAKEEKEYEAKLPQTVKGLEIKLKEFGDILSNITKQLETNNEKKSGLMSVLNDYWKVMSVSTLGLLQTIILIVIYTKFYSE